MKKISFLFAAFVLVFRLGAQIPEDSLKRIRPLVATVTLLDRTVVTGMVLNVSDSQLYLTRSSRAASLQQRENPYIVNAASINAVRIKRKNSGLRGAAFGFGIGLASGVILGLASGNDNPNEWFAMTAGEKAVGLGALLGTGGGLIGAIIGAISGREFTIGGRKEKFRDLQSELMMRLVRN